MSVADSSFIHVCSFCHFTTATLVSEYLGFSKYYYVFSHYLLNAMVLITSISPELFLPFFKSYLDFSSLSLSCLSQLSHPIFSVSFQMWDFAMDLSFDGLGGSILGADFEEVHQLRGLKPSGAVALFFMKMVRRTKFLETAPFSNISCISDSEALHHNASLTHDNSFGLINFFF